MEDFSIALSLCAMAMSGAASTALAVPEEANPLRPRLDLNGPWDFRMDPAGEGVGQGWFNADVPYPATIRVPGNWQAQGFGEPRRHLRHDYQGKAWYRRVVRIPEDWQGRCIWLHLGGVTNTAEVFVNGQRVGSVEGFLTPYELDLTPVVRPGGNAVIACQVDSTGPAPVGMFNFFGRWGGLYRPVWLEARPDPAIDDLFVMPDVRNAMARTQVALRRSAPGAAWEARLRVRITPLSGGPVSSGEGTLRFGEGQTQSDLALVEVPVRDLHPWSPEDPFLYQVEASIEEDGRPTDTVRDRFGMRQFEVGQGGQLLLNGQPYFVRGLGDDCVEVLTGTAAADKQVYLERIRLCKRYGYNGFRFLAHTPAREIFEAADEAGFLIMAEGAIYWKLKDQIPLLKRQVERIARAYRNHPSWYIWSSGNELFECQGPAPDPDWMDYIQYAHDTFKRLDPTRFFVASDGADVFPTDLITQAAKFSDTPAGFDQPFDGLVDEVAYFRHALSDGELFSLSKARTDYADLVRSLEPSGYWRLHETTVGSVADASGHSHHGFHEPATTMGDLDQPGALFPADPDSALRTGEGGRSVSLREVAAATFVEKNQPFSLSLWVRPNGFRRNDWGTPFSYGAARDGCAFLLSLDGEGGDGKIVIGRWMANLPASQGRLMAGQWNHIGLTYDGASLKLFLNGHLDQTIPVKLSTVVVDGRIGNLIQAGGADRSRYQKLPHLWHEFPNTYIGPLPDLTIDAQYTGVFQDDDCIARHRREIADYGLTDRYPEIRQRSVDLFYLYLKQVYEAARSSPSLDGYAYWLMTDVPGGVEGDHNTMGLLSTVYEPEKFPDPASFLRFNRETVLFLNAGPDQRTMATGETRTVSVGLSHFGQEPIRDGRLHWQIRTVGGTQAEGVGAGLSVEVGEVREIGRVPLGPYDFDRAEKLTLGVRLESDACQQENEWDFWVFPARKRDFSGDGIGNPTGLRELDRRYARPKERARLILAAQLTGEVLESLTAGGRVILLAENGSLARPLRFTYWPEWIRQIGNLVEKHPALEGFPHDGFCAFQFYRLFGPGLEAVDLTERGSVERTKLTPLVWGLKMDYDPVLGLPWSDPDNRWKAYRAGLVCEGRVGNGKLIVCSLRVLEGLRNSWPEAGCLLDCLVDYALSDRFEPPLAALSPEEARQVFKAPKTQNSSAL